MKEEISSKSVNLSIPGQGMNNSMWTTGQAINKMVEDDLKRGPLRLAVDDPKLLAKTATLRKDNESLNSFISWSGLNYRQISEWRMDKLEPWCKQAERNNENYPEPNAIRDANQKPVV